MKKNLLYILMPLVLVLGIFVNSCKKELDSDIPNVLVNGAWQLSSVRITVNRGDTVKLDTTYAVNCNQTFTFNSDQTCTYTNFDCIDQTSKGGWELVGNRLFLVSNIVCKDTTAAGSSKPFTYCSINSLGRYSMVLLTGDFINYNNSALRRVVRYGFVKQKAASQ